MSSAGNSALLPGAGVVLDKHMAVNLWRDTVSRLVSSIAAKYAAPDMLASAL